MALNTGTRLEHFFETTKLLTCADEQVGENGCWVQCYDNGDTGMKSGSCVRLKELVTYMKVMTEYIANIPTRRTK